MSNRFRGSSQTGSGSSEHDSGGKKASPSASKQSPGGAGRPKQGSDKGTQSANNSGGKAGGELWADSTAGRAPSQFTSCSGLETERQQAATQADADEAKGLFKEGYAFEGATVVALVEREDEDGPKAMNIVLEDGIMLTLDLDSGEKRLIELGYTQTLKRDLTGFELFAIGFTCMGLFVGIIPYYGLAFSNGGPVAVVWYWWISGVLTLCLMAALAEISSSFPLAGTMYFWAAHLAPPKLRPLTSWITGWLELLGTSISLSGVVLFGGSSLVNIMVMMGSSVYQEGVGWVATKSLSAPALFGIACANQVALGVMNCLKIKTIGRLVAVTCIYQITLAMTLIICVPLVAPTTQPASFVFGTYLRNWEGTTPNAAYAFVLAMLAPQYAQFAADGAAHLAEEVKKADITAPLAMLGSFVVFLFLVWGVLVTMTFCIQDIDSLSATDTVTGGHAMFAQILWDVFYSRFGSGAGALTFLILIYISIFFSSVSLMLVGCRVAYSLARDGALPFSAFFCQVDSRKVPIAAVFLVCAIGMVPLIFSLFSQTAYYTLTSMATIGWFASYAPPIFFRLISPEESFTPGPFYLAKCIGTVGGKTIHLIGLLFVGYTVCSFSIPVELPVGPTTFNYGPVAIIGVVLLLLIWWVVDAKFWFLGPHMRSEPGRHTQDHAAQEPPRS